ncbi:MAG: hypothetical protein EOQ65_21475 [Mesorhizobium sp.]|uniref:hypothetical protein n=1 Tax=Mesorhizobium sp. TaxID=1871066 RepID=UPI000FE492BF|nr:hypothetical protein [Mesorhizobium sp.]RWG57953.1 MAG: hypothetical protein EOQ65_21475 [Mesorhizobium sp.]
MLKNKLLGLHLAAPTVAIAVAGAVGTVSFAQVAPEVSDPEKLVIETDAGTQLVSYGIDMMKKQFPVRERATRTPWTKTGEVERFRGVFLKDLLAKHDLDEHAVVEVRADDGFMARVPKADIDSYAPMIAYEKACTDADRHTGRCDADDTYRPLDIDESGPFFVVWPYDNLPASYIPARNNLWVWWVIAVRPVK